MANALACQKCGNTIVSDRIKLDFNGSCPWCLAAFALGEPPLEESAPHAKAPDRLGKYLLTEKLGTGGMGEVWKAFDTELNRWVALKFLKDQDSKEKARFTREAHMAAKLSHPGIAAVHEIGEIGGRRYIVMQCIEGRTLETFPRNDRRLLVRLCMEAAKALDHAHRNGVIHRDVKPANLMVEETAEGAKVVVLDFGLARPIEGGDKLSVSGSVVGTPQYLSPEQARAERLDERTDVYSLGVTMYEIFTGKAPFEAKNVYEILKKIETEEPVAPRKVTPRISQDLEKIIQKCLEKNRDRRYAGAKELADDLRRFLDHEPVLARPPSTIYRLRMKLSQRKSLVAAVASALVLVVGGAILLTKLNAESQARARLVAYQSAYSDGRNAWDEVLQIVQRAPLEHAARKARQARSHFERAIGILEQADAHVMRGKCLQLEGNQEEAEKAWERALELDPENQEARFHLAKKLLLSYCDARTPSFAVRDKASSKPRMVENGPESKVEIRLRLRAEKLLAGIGGNEKAVYLRGVLEVSRLRYREGADLLAQYNKEGWDATSTALEGQARLYLGDYDGAIRAFTKAIELNPKLVTVYGIRGLAREFKGLRDEAIADYTEAIKIDPKHSIAYQNRGGAKASQDLLDEAIADLDEAIRLDPSFSAAFYNRGNVRSSQGLRDAAISDFSEAIRLDPTFALAWHNRGCERSAKGLHGEAIADLTEAIRLNPKSAGNYYNRGVAKGDHGLREEAIADYTEAIKLDPNYTSAYYNRGNARKAKGLLDEALADYTEAIRLDPKHLKAFDSRGTVKRAKGFLDEALADYNEAIKLDPKDPVPYSNRGALYWDEKRLYDEAMADFNEAIRLDPSYAQAYYNRGTAKRGKGHLDAAIADYTEAIRLDPKFAPAYFNRGNAYRARGLRDAALADYTEAIKLDPKDAKGFYSRGCVKLDRDQFDEAILDFNEAIRLDPNHAEAYTNRGNAKREKGQVDAAIADYNEAIKRNPKLALAYYNRGVVMSDRGSWDKAIADYDKAIECDPDFEQAYYNRGNAKAAKALLNEAVDDFTAAIALDSKFPEAYANRAFAKARKGLIEEAIEDWRKALNVAPSRWSYREMVQGYVATRGAQIIIDEANRLHGLKKYREAIEKFRSLVDSHPGTPWAIESAYNIACGYALLGDKKNALDWLEKTVQMGWKDLAHLEKDPDLESLRNEEQYKKLTAKMKGK